MEYLIIPFISKYERILLNINVSLNNITNIVNFLDFNDFL